MSSLDAKSTKVMYNNLHRSLRRVYWVMRRSHLQSHGSPSVAVPLYLALSTNSSCNMTVGSRSGLATDIIMQSQRRSNIEIAPIRL